MHYHYWFFIQKEILKHKILNCASLNSLSGLTDPFTEFKWFFWSILSNDPEHLFHLKLIEAPF